MIELAENIVLATTHRAEAPQHVFAVEEGYCRRMAAKRRDDFVTGRNCARRSLAGHGMAPCAIAMGPAHEPLWPADIVGSITHCQGFYAAATARKADYRGIGIDAEPDGLLPREILPLVLTEREMDDCRRRTSSALPLCRILFSAKESIFKAIYPLLRRYVDFLDVEVAVEASAAFHAVLPPELARGVAAETVHGTFFRTGSHIFTVATIERHGRPSGDSDEEISSSFIEAKKNPGNRLFTGNRD